MADPQAQIEIFMPGELLKALDQAVEEENLSRTAWIRQAIEQYLWHGPAIQGPRFFSITQWLRYRFAEVSDDEIENRIKLAMASTSGRRGPGRESPGV